jgi:carboxypeptidase C (cathepsin A)
VDNACTWLEFTDLVFIDPLGCGYSTPAAGIDPKEYFSVEGDVRTVGEFIRLYISQEQRWLSPKYLVGESYGTTRAAGLAKHLQDRVGMNLNGLVLISSALSFEPISFGRGNELPCMLYLPSYAAVAWYHRQPSATSDVELEGLLARVQEFALTEYGPALARGDDLGDEQRERMVATLAELTGLTPPYINRSHLRIRNSDFAKELLSGRGELVGLLDGRVTGATTNPTAQGLDYDPSLFVVEGPFTQAVQDYLRRDLGFVTTRRYEFLSPKAIESWDWSTAGRGYLNVAGQLQEAMTKNTRLRVLAVAGYFDLTCGYYAQQYMFSHLQLAPSLKSHIRFVAYPAGHQVYTHEPSLKQLTAEAARFMKE